MSLGRIIEEIDSADRVDDSGGPNVFLAVEQG
jgi:hypothetical protein